MAVDSLSARISARRLLVALIAIPIVDAILGYIGFPLVWWLGDHGGFRPVAPEQTARAFGALAGVLGLLVMITAALPVALQLMRRGHTSIQHFALAGVVLGNLPFSVYLAFVIAFALAHLVAGTLGDHLSPPGELLAGGLRVIAIGSVMGTASGVMFWLIAVRGRPD